MLFIFIIDLSFLIVLCIVEESFEIFGYVLDMLGRIKMI